MPCGSRAFDGRLGATRKELLELENFGWEVGETEWEDDQVCIGWLGRLVGVRSGTHEVSSTWNAIWRNIVPVRFAALGYYYGVTSFVRINQQDVQVVATN